MLFYCGFLTSELNTSLVGLYCLTSLCNSLYASGHSQRMPLLNYSDSKAAYLYDFAGLDALWDKVPDLRILDVKLIGVLRIPKLESRTNLNWTDAAQTKDEAEGWELWWKAALPGHALICQAISFPSVNWLHICKLFDSSQPQTHTCIFCI